MSKKGTDVWEDREVKFDLPYSLLKLRAGEKIFDRIDSMEDTKGNSGMKGRMLITNLRIMWHSVSSPRINLSIGLNCIMTVTTRMVTSGLRGTAQALYILTAFKFNRYEFMFTNLSPNSTRHFTSVTGVHKSYVASRLYRDLKLRGAIVRNKQLNLLPSEKIVLNENSVWNLSSDTGNLGTLVVTNIRIVWFADINEAFNISLPYISVDSIRVRESKFGEALVIVSKPSRGGYVLGFRIDPPDKLHMLQKELATMHSVYTANPTFGVEINWQNEPSVRDTRTEDIEEIEEVGEPRGEMSSALYLASQASATDQETEPPAPVYSSYLGLAIEPLREGFTLKGLWEVQPS